jgi:hypothetical protein
MPTDDLTQLPGITPSPEPLILADGVLGACPDSLHPLGPGCLAHLAASRKAPTLAEYVADRNAGLPVDDQGMHPSGVTAPLHDDSAPAGSAFCPRCDMRVRLDRRGDCMQCQHRPPSTLERVQQEARDIAARSTGSLTFYTLLFVVVDGHLQAQEQKVDVRCNASRVRVYMRASVPARGLELDCRESVVSGRLYRVGVLGPAGEYVVVGDMRCTHFAIGHTVNKEACARYIFECKRDDAAVKPTDRPPPEYYEGKARR